MADAYLNPTPNKSNGGTVVNLIKSALMGSSTSVFAWPNRLRLPGQLVPDYQRINNYNRYALIYYGQFGSAFPSDPNFQGLSPDQGAVNLAAPGTTTANLAAKTVDALAAAVWPDSPRMTTDDVAMTEFGNGLLDDPRITIALNDVVHDTVLYGDGIIKVYVDNGKLCVVNVNPASYFPELDPGNPQNPQTVNLIYNPNPQAEVVLWTRERYWFNPDTGTYWLRVTQFSSSNGDETAPIQEEDLKTSVCPIIHCYGRRSAGIHYGNAALASCERMVAEYASCVMKLAAITDLASTKAIGAFPEYAFDDQGNLIAGTGRPMKIEEADIATFNKVNWGWLEPPGIGVIEPILKVMDTYKADVTEAFGMTGLIYGDTNQMRDVGAPGLERLNLGMKFTVNNYQQHFNMFLTDLMNVAAQMGNAFVPGIEGIPTEMQKFTFVWPDFVPLGELEKAQIALAKNQAGVPKSVTLAEMGYTDTDALVEESNAEMQSGFQLPPPEYDPANPDPAMKSAAQEQADVENK